MNRFIKHFVLLIAMLLASVQSGLAYAYEEEIDGVTAYFSFNAEDRTLNLEELSDKKIESFNVPAKASNGLDIVTVRLPEYYYLKSITIPNGVKKIYLSGCKSLQSIKIPNTVTSILQSAFEGCTSLKSIEIPSSVTSIGLLAFKNCKSLESIDIPNSVNEIEWCQNYNWGSKNFLFEGCEALKYVKISSRTDIGYCAFRDCKNLESIIISNSVTSIGATAFQGCTSLTSVVIPNSVTDIGYSAFEGCTSLTSVYIPNSVTEINSTAFKGCTSLTSVEIPNSVTTIKWDAFCGCTSLTSIDIPNSVTSIGAGAFEGCTSLTSVEIPNSVTDIGSSAFKDCTSLKSIVIPEGVTSIEGWIFSGCTSLESVVIPNSVVSIGETNGVELFSGNLSFKPMGGAFEGCTNLKDIIIPEGVASIGAYTFKGCTNLTSVILPSSLKRIGFAAFYDCKGIMSIKMYAKNPPEVFSSILYRNETYPHQRSIDFVFDYLDVMSILYVPTGTKEKYKSYESITDYRSGDRYYYIYNPYNNYYIEEFDPEEDPFGNNDGIETIVSNDYDGVIDVYNMSGVKVLSTYNKDEIDNLPKGIYVVRAGQKPEKYIVK